MGAKAWGLPTPRLRVALLIQDFQDIFGNLLQLVPGFIPLLPHSVKKDCALVTFMTWRFILRKRKRVMRGIVKALWKACLKGGVRGHEMRWPQHLHAGSRAGGIWPAFQFTSTSTGNTLVFPVWNLLKFKKKKSINWPEVLIEAVDVGVPYRVSFDSWLFKI